MTLDQESIKETYQSLSRTGNWSHLGTSHDVVIFSHGFVNGVTMTALYNDMILLVQSIKACLTIQYRPFSFSKLVFTAFHWLNSFMVLVLAANVLYIVCICLMTQTNQKLHPHHMCAGHSY